MKIKDLKKDERSETKQEIDSAGEVIGLDSWEKEQATSFGEEAERFGLCIKCDMFKYVKYEFSGDIAECVSWDKVLSGRQRIVECSRFSPRGTLTLNQMVDIAHLIDLDDKKTGFLK